MVLLEIIPDLAVDLGRLRYDFKVIVYDKTNILPVLIFILG